MKIELRNFKHAAFASEETLCFSATLFVNDMKTANVNNDGRGGCTHIYAINQPLLKETEAYCKTLPDVPSGFIDGKPLKMDLEFFLDIMAAEKVTEKELKSKMRTKIVVQKPDGEIYYASIRGAKLTDEMVQKYQDLNPTYKVLNLMPLNQALELYAIW